MSTLVAVLICVAASLVVIGGLVYVMTRPEELEGDEPQKGEGA